MGFDAHNWDVPVPPTQVFEAGVAEGAEEGMGSVGLGALRLFHRSSQVRRLRSATFQAQS